MFIGRPFILWLLTHVSTVVTSGWKPIPPPRGAYLAKSHVHPSLRIPLAPLEGPATLLDTPRIGGADPTSVSEIFFNSPSHTYKFSSDIENVFKKDPLKSYHKPSGGKLTSYSYNNFNRNRVKVYHYHDRPETYGLTDDLLIGGNKLTLPSFSDNEIKTFGAGISAVPDERQCSLYKVAFRQDLYFQYVQYKVAMPDMKEFTLCMWTKFSNHSNDHPLLSYAVRNQPRAIYAWISTTDRSNYFNLAINGHSIFRLNYPIRLNKWYHNCASWNGKTGEWQVWVNGERIGRGFHNLLVGHVIPGGGIVITGQEQRQLGGGFLEGPDAPKGSGGFLGEIVMLQLYRVALTAGKAYNDHRHHHSLHASTTPEPPAPPSSEDPPSTEHPFLENGQLKKNIPVFELAEAIRPKPLNPPEPTMIQGLDVFGSPFATPFIAGLDSTLLTPFTMMAFPGHSLFKRTNEKDIDDVRNKRNDETKVKYVEPTQPVHVEKIRFADKRKSKREISSNSTLEFITVDEDKTEPEPSSEEPEREGRGMKHLRPIRQNSYGIHMGTSRRPGKRTPAVRKESLSSDTESNEHDTEKRQVLLGDLGFSHFRLPSPTKYRKPEVADNENNTEETFDETEPAQQEVRRIMAVCSGCEPDPFRKVAVISWRSTPKKIYSGALFIKTRPECKRF